jgi:hypothetical protein
VPLGDQHRVRNGGVQRLRNKRVFSAEARKVTEEADLLGYVKVILQILMYKQAAHTWKAACLCLCHGEFFSGCYAQKGIGRVVI